MAISGLLFLSWRLFQLVTLVPIVGMLSYFVHGFVERNQLTPNFILVLFIISVLALAWVFFTLISYLRARHDALFVAFVDLAFIAALIAAVVVMRRIAKSDCANFQAGSIYVDLGPFGYYGRAGGDRFSLNLNKNCAMLKASWALAIINILAFAVTFFLALFVHRNHRNEDKVVVKREYHTSRHSHRRSASRDHRSSRDEYRPSSGRRSTHRSSSRRQYYV